MDTVWAKPVINDRQGPQVSSLMASGWTRRDPGQAKLAERRTWVPDDAAAEIYRPAPSVMQSAPFRRRPWVLKFERRSPSWIEPLMGYTAGGDTLQQVELHFPDKDAAVRYAERQGLSYRLRDTQAVDRGPSVELAPSAWCRSEMEQAEIDAASPIPPKPGENETIDLAAALAAPASVFRSPEAVIRQSWLSVAEKRKILQRWAEDERRQDESTTEGMPEFKASLYDEIMQMLTRLEGASSDDIVLIIGNAPERRISR
ncbi:NADH dehydrogenase ubiquinone Fe-S protein 4 [Consotaella salsifontis]|uniref:ETC complex I subunit conserved region n=1 Tax=Consotaella salsifontis TaxID=1365950 RepID=A0A1T4S9Y3_9HYPH|nr:NADH dehydrogenase ubiquinone Fe-S protein 4 [Consotaella salsifontis]SKA24906.1 ETC complex I subunit conserved region [Consotaella salsifontis]